MLLELQPEVLHTNAIIAAHVEDLLEFTVLDAIDLCAVMLLGPVLDVAGDVLHGADVDELSFLPVPLLVVVDEGVQLAVDVQDGDGLVQVAACAILLNYISL